MDLRKNSVLEMFKNGFSRNHISKQLNMCSKTINKILIENNILIEKKEVVRLTPEEKEKAVNMYLKGDTMRNIAIFFNKHVSTIEYLINKLELSRRNDDNMKPRYNVKEILRENSETYFIKECSICKKDKKILSSAITIKNKYTWCCIDCYLHTDKINNEVSNGKKRKTNTSGFIGVYAKTLHGEPLGYYAVIIYKKQRLMSQLYKDETLNKKTLIQAAIDRDLFIIEKNLPHRRNFTDNELFANMEYLAYEQIENIKKLINNRKLL